MRAEINEVENRKTLEKNQCFIEMISKIDKSLATLRKKKDTNITRKEERQRT